MMMMFTCSSSQKENIGGWKSKELRLIQYFQCHNTQISKQPQQNAFFNWSAYGLKIYVLVVEHFLFQLYFFQEIKMSLCIVGLSQEQQNNIFVWRVRKHQVNCLCASRNQKVQLPYVTVFFISLPGGFTDSANVIFKKSIPTYVHMQKYICR